MKSIRSAAYHLTEPFVLHTNKKEGESFKIEGRLLGGCFRLLISF